MYTNTRRTLVNTTSQFSTPDFIPEWANAFYRAKRAENVSSNTQIFYRQQLAHFLKFCDAQLLEHLSELTPEILRKFILWHEETGHNPGGLHAAYRVLKTFLLWYEGEAEPDGWKNPIRKVKAPKLVEDPLTPVEVEDVFRMAETCETDFYGVRDKAILLGLLDTGARAREFLSINLEDVNQVTGAVLIRHGKGRKSRTVYLGKRSRRALRAYLHQRRDQDPALFVTDEGERLHYGGLLKVIAKRASLAAIECPSPHDFRRSFALNMLRAGTDVITLARLMGHSDLKTLQRYLRQLPDDLQAAHAKGSPVDRAREYYQT